MRRCSTCGQSFSDEYDFCLNDGTPLAGQSVSQPTVVLPSPARSVTNTAVAEPAKRGNAVLFLAFGVILILAVAVVGLAVAFFMSSRGSGDDKQIAVNKSSNAQKDTDEQNRLKQQQDQINADSQRLADERKRLENDKQKLERQKQTAGPLPAGTSAMIIDPPTNIRLSPNGVVQCVIKSRTVITILNSPSIADKNGVWYRTSACGGIGFVHSSQISFSY